MIGGFKNVKQVKNKHLNKALFSKGRFLIEFVDLSRVRIKKNIR